MIQQKEFTLQRFNRGFHLITHLIEKELSSLPESGILHLFIKHTSAALSLNENADSSVRRDMEQIMNHLLPQSLPYITHTLEGDDDMPAHAKSSLIGSSVSIPVSRGRLNLGTWQGIYLCEFRDFAENRQIVATIIS